METWFLKKLVSGVSSCSEEEDDNRDGMAGEGRRAVTSRLQWRGKQALLAGRD